MLKKGKCNKNKFPFIFVFFVNDKTAKVMARKNMIIKR